VTLRTRLSLMSLEARENPSGPDLIEPIILPGPPLSEDPPPPPPGQYGPTDPGVIILDPMQPIG
jgi:hypothetical protein